MPRTPLQRTSADTSNDGENAALIALVRRAIDAAGGAISFADYMDLALFAPGLGYYSGGADQFGGSGDFVTAPEISPLFARCMARQIVEIVDGLGGGAVCEVGAGTGALAGELLDALADAGYVPPRYTIVERSASLVQCQRESLASRQPKGSSKVRWKRDIPQDFRGVLIANEVLDAMPAHRFRMRGDGPRELGVGWRDGRFRWIEEEATGAAIAQHVQSMLHTLDHALAPGYEFECAPARQDWIGHLGARLEAGVALVVDYGYARAEYYHPQRSRGTLRCFHRHRAHDDPLVLTGLQDISVHVDFTALAEAAVAAGLALAGYTTQAEFLLATGLLEVCRDVDPASREHAELTAQIKRLTLPGEMGEAIKVLALARGYEGSLTGFSGRDLRARL